MHPYKRVQKFIASFLALAAAPLLVQVRCAASPVQQQQSQQQPPMLPTLAQPSQPASQQTSSLDLSTSKQRKVWTNDDLILLRTPADIYLLEKEAKEAAEAEAAAQEAAKAAAESEKQSQLDIKLPDTLQETEIMLKATEDNIREETDALDKMQKEFLSASTEQQPEKQKEIDRITANLATLRRDLKALQDHLQTFSTKPPVENPPTPSQPTSF